MRVLSLMVVLIHTILTTFAQTTVNSTINSNTVWTPAGSPYLVGSSASIAAGRTLTIQPGVVVKFTTAYDDFEVNGNIVAQGTDTQPIVFTSAKDDQYGGDSNKDGAATKPSDQDWESILIKATSGAGSVFFKCHFRYGGYYFGSNAAINVEGSSPTISECNFFFTHKSIFVRQGGKPTINKCRFESTTKMAISISLGSQPLMADNTFIKNGINGLGIVTGTYTGTANYTLEKIKPAQFPYASYVIDDGLTLNADVNLTIEPGVIIKFGTQYEDYNFNGILKAEGTATEPIIFTSIKDDEYGGDTNNDGNTTKPGNQDWESIFIRNSASNLKHCTVRYGGYYSDQYAALMISGASPLIENCSFFQNERSIFCTTGANATIRNCIFRENARVPISISLSSNPIFENNNFINNKINGLGIVALTYTGPANYTLKKIKPEQFPYSSYVIEGDMTLNSDVNLTIEPGVIIKFTTTYDLYSFNGKLNAEGSASEPIIFTSIKDDEFGGDTNNDGAATKPSNEDWRSLAVRHRQSSLKFCTFRYGGYYFDESACVELGAESSATISDCQFFRVNRAINLGANAAPIITNCNFTECANAPISIQLSSKPTLSNNTFVNNSINAIGLIGGVYSTAATHTLRKISPAGNGNANAYYLEESLTLDANVTLNIEPGTIIKIKGASGGSRVFIDVKGKLNAKGTAAEPVIFTSSRDDTFGGDTHNNGSNDLPERGDWYSIILNASSTGASSFEHCQFRYGGYLNGFPLSQYGAIRVMGSNAHSIKNCSFFANSQGIIIGNSGNPIISDCAFTESGWAPISLGLSAAPVFSNITFSRNHVNAVGIIAGEYTGVANYTLGKLSIAGIDNIPYYIQQDITLAKDISLKIQPGVIIKFRTPETAGQNVRIKVDGQVIAEGTTSEPIIFTADTDDQYGGDTNNDGSSSKPDYGDWYGFIISNESKDSKFDNCLFRYGGYYNYSSESGFGAVRSLGKSKPSIINCTFEYNSEGVVAAGFSTPIIKGNNFVDCGWTAVSMALTANPTFEDNKIDRFTTAAIGLLYGTYADKGDFYLKKRDFAGIKNAPYFINSWIYLEAGFNWIIEPGVVIKMYEEPEDYYNNRIIVSGSIRAEGTLGEPIVFTSANDDEFGGDSYFNGNGNPPERGDWHGITLNNSSTSRFKYCKFRYGGFSTQSPQYGALLINSSSPPLLSKCEFTNNTRGVVVAGTSTVTLDSCDFSKNVVGLHKEGGNVRIKESNIFDNVDFGVQNVTTVDVDATLNWWGDPTGPQHAQKNPGGKGNKVSNYVLFEPWQQQKVTFKNDVGVVSILTPNTACNFSSAETVKVAITNFGSVPQTGFQVVVLVNNVEVVRENVGAFQVINQTTAEYTLRTKVDLSAYKDYEIKVFTVLNNEQNIYNDSKVTTVRNYRSIAANAQFSSLQPLDNEPEVEATQAFFSWSPIENAAAYDLYVWLAIGIEPRTPTVSNLTTLNYQFSSALVYGAQYRWKVVARNPCSSVSSPIQTFKVKSLPDLVIKQIKVPNAPFSGQLTEITWETINQGTNNTGAVRWYDAVYLSQDSVLDTEEDYYLGAVYNDIALNAGEGFTQMGRFVLPKEVENRYYVFVVADYFNYIREFNDNNNSRFTGIDIKLTPPPDLTVSSVIAPFNAFSEQFIPISYTVGNIGQGPTVEVLWRDRIYLSQDVELNINRATLLGTYSHSGNLLPGQAYTRKENIALPKGVAGKYFVHVRTDVDNQVFEYAYEENNEGRSDTMEITLTPPPDLQVSNFQVPLNVSNGERATLRWTVNNLGASKARGNWNDEIYISKSAVFNNQAVYIGGQYQFNRELLPNTTYTISAEISIPNNINGAYYFFVFTDADNSIFEYNKEDNNIRRADQDVKVLSPDLAVQNVSTANTAISGQAVPLSWTVQNAGAGVLQNVTRRDVIFLSRTSTFDLKTATRIDSVEYSGQLQVGQSISRQKTITLPNGVSGIYYLFVFTDANQRVFENGSESNNLAQATLNISLAPWPDLQVTNIEGVPASIVAGNAIQLTYTVQNKGQGNVVNRVWKDRIYLSPSPTWKPDLAKPLQEIDVVQSLPNQASYMRSANFRLPMMGANMAGVCFLYIFTDANNALYEHTDEGNNTLRSIPINVTVPPPVDLDLLSVQADTRDTLQSGQKVNLRWQVKNIGSSTEIWYYYYWYDGVYLSKDQKWDAGDQFIFDWTEQAPLGAQEEYEDKQSFALPPGISGDYYLLMVSDHTGLIRDGNPQNNVRSLSGNKAIHFKKRNYADLTLSDYQITSNALAGQPLKLSWKVKNTGEGSTLGSTWADKAYLSTDNRLDNFDPTIVTYNRTGSLNPGEEYQVETEAIIPITAKGNYLLWLKTDANNNEFEVPSEQNNALSVPINVTVPPPADLQVAAIQHPDSTFVGAEIMVEWTSINKGTNPVNGRRQDFVYLSQDDQWDLSDRVLGSKVIEGNLPPGGQDKQSLKVMVPGVETGQYYLIAQADGLNNIVEHNDTNNIGISGKTIQIGVKTLPLNVLTADVLKNEQNLYYKIEIADSLAGETLLVTLQGDSLSGVNELFLSYEKTPTRSDHHFASSTPFTSKQQILIPSLEPGTYYLLANGNKRGTPPQQNIALLARIVPFEVRSVKANRGGNSGTITVKMEGGKFEEAMVWSLKSSTGEIITAHNVYFINSTQAFVSFNLSDVALGQYDVQAQKANGDSAILVKGFEVVEGSSLGIGSGAPNNGFVCSIENTDTEELISTAALHPPNTRRNRIVTMRIQYANVGNVDVPTPTRFLFSLEQAPISFIINDLDKNAHELLLEFVDKDGPPGILRPGSSGSIVVYTKAVAPLRFLLTE